MTIVAFHGTAVDFDAFRPSPAGVHFGSFDQAAHVASMALGGMRPEEFARRPEVNGWRGRIIRVELAIENAKRIPDPMTDLSWIREIERARAEGYDAIVYENAWEGREKTDSYAVWDLDQVTIVEGYCRDPEPCQAAAPRM